MKPGCEHNYLSKLVLSMAAFGCFAGLLLLAGCNQPAPVDTKAIETTVKNADAQVLKAATAHDLTTLLTFYADDAVSLPANEELLTNRSEMQKSWAERLTPGVSVSWTPMYVDVAKSGDLAYILGSYTMTTKVAKGKPLTDTGKYLAVWKKQADGTWKVEADTWNSDLPVKGK
ncbi:MAG: YybH family protein [Acidobacteriaceae bacterium]